jgi:hypothetical protein
MSAVPPHPAPLKQRTTLSLEGFHKKTLLREMCVYVAAVPNQSPLSHAVERDAEREDAAEGGRLAGNHRAQGDTLCYRRRDEVRVIPH